MVIMVKSNTIACYFTLHYLSILCKEFSRSDLTSEVDVESKRPRSRTSENAQELD